MIRIRYAYYKILFYSGTYLKRDEYDSIYLAVYNSLKYEILCM